MTTTQVVRSYTGTLVANTEDRVTFTQLWDGMEVINQGAGTLYCRGDGGAATVAGAGCVVVLANERIVVKLAWNYTTGQGTLSLISAGTPTYTVTGTVSSGAGGAGGGGTGITQAAADTRYVNASGDAMTGGLQAWTPIELLQQAGPPRKGYIHWPDSQRILIVDELGAGMQMQPSVQMLGSKGTADANGGQLRVLDSTDPSAAFTGLTVQYESVTGTSIVLITAWRNGVSYRFKAAAAAGAALEVDGPIRSSTSPVVKTTAPVAADYAMAAVPTNAIWIDTSGASSVVKTWTGSAWK